MSWEDIDTAVVKTTKFAAKHKLPGIRAIEPNPNLAAVKKAAQCSDQESAALEAEAALVDRDLQVLITECSSSSRGPAAGGASGLGRHRDVVDVGVAALGRYGLGACSARHYYGSFDTHVELEKKLAGLYPSLARQAGGCEGEFQRCPSSCLT